MEALGRSWNALEALRRSRKVREGPWKPLESLGWSVEGFGRLVEVLGRPWEFLERFGRSWNAIRNPWGCPWNVLENPGTPLESLGLRLAPPGRSRNALGMHLDILGRSPKSLTSVGGFGRPLEVLGGPCKVLERHWKPSAKSSDKSWLVSRVTKRLVLQKAPGNTQGEHNLSKSCALPQSFYTGELHNLCFLTVFSNFLRMWKIAALPPEGREGRYVCNMPSSHVETHCGTLGKWPSVL